MAFEQAQFDKIGDDYSSFIEHDPVRNFLHYPAIIKKIHNTHDAVILDIGCGDGTFDRILAKKTGARIIAFDIAPHLIKIASNDESATSSSITYSVSDQFSFNSSQSCDYAVAVMVLPYAKDQLDLEGFFACAARHLKSNQSFYTIIFNPEFSAFNRTIANRKFTKLPAENANKVQVHFLDPISKIEKFTSILSQYSKEVYESVAKSAGFNEVNWEPIYATEQAITALSAKFWQKCHQTQPYSLVSFQK